QLARVSGLGMTTFYKKFKSSTDYSPIDFIQRERINLSKVMIANRQYGLKEIAYRCGFNSYEYFCSSFKKLEQVKPSDFKKRQASTV
ncbi:MAG: AraC family transcriptional regulator, partial [Bacteroidota bacterium]